MAFTSILRMISDQPPEPKRRKVQDFEDPPTVDVPVVLLPKVGDLSLVNRNRRMFKQLVVTLEQCRREDAKLLGSKAHIRSLDSFKRIEEGIVNVNEVKDVAQKKDYDYAGEETVIGVNASAGGDIRSNTCLRRVGDKKPQMRDSKALPSGETLVEKLKDPSLVNKNESAAALPRNEVETLINVDVPFIEQRKDVSFIEQRKELAKKKAHKESECLRQNTNELIAENGRDLTVITLVPAKVGEKDMEVHHEKLQRFLRTKAEPPINYSFAKSFGADVPLIEQRKEQGFTQVRRKTNFVHIEKIGGKEINVLQGLELYTNVFSPDKQIEIVNCIYELQQRGQNGQLRGRTYSEPKRWMQGKGRITIQFGCCYNYAKDRNGNPPGILRNEEVEPLPPLFKKMIKKMVSWHIIPPTCVPDSCIVNIYEVGDCIPPHIDHHDFLRPFCTVSFLTECKILFGSNLEIVGAGKFKGPVSIPLPVGSILIINGNGADIAKHCVPSVHHKRISITFRKMDKSKLPYSILPD